MIKTDKYDYLSSVISLLNSTEFISSISSLAEECNVPIQFMRNTFIALLKNRTFQACLSTTDSYENDTDFYLVEDFIDDPETYSAEIMSGEYDDVEWVIDLKLLNQESELLPLSGLELGALKSFGADIFSLKRASLFEKKDIAAPVPAMVKENQKRITAAIEQGKAITFDYKNKNGRIIQRTILPVRVSTNVTDNWIYVRSSDGRSYRLDRFVHACKLTAAPESIAKKQNPNQKYYWGTSSYREPAPTHVKILIYDETSNIINKVKNDLAFRSETGKLYHEKDSYYYEDDIIGLNDFRRWIRGYGSSIIVLEPKELRDDIVAHAKEALSNYDASRGWKI